jgi:phosphate transport system protein
MIPLEYEIDRLKEIFQEMMELVRDQLALTKEALLTGDTETAAEVMRKEGRVNSYELNIDRECEDFLALHSPVATDLRLVIAVLKMSGGLERIGDHVYRIACMVYDEELKLKKDLINRIQLPELFDDIDEMLGIVAEAFEKGDGKKAKQVFKKDKIIDKVNKKIPGIMKEYLKDSKDDIENVILVARVIGKLERTGDHIKNIAEEIIFHSESKVIKHKKKNKRILKRLNLKGFGNDS